LIYNQANFNKQIKLVSITFSLSLKFMFRRLGNIMAHSRQPSMRELNAFHIVQQNALKGKIENAWTQKMLDTLWKNLAADPIF